MRCSWSMIYGTLQHTLSLNRSLQPTDCTEQVETCHTPLLRFDAPLPVLKIPAFPLDRTRQQHSPYFLITHCTYKTVWLYRFLRLWYRYIRQLVTSIYIRQFDNIDIKHSFLISIYKTVWYYRYIRQFDCFKISPIKYGFAATYSTTRYFQIVFRGNKDFCRVS